MRDKRRPLLTNNFFSFCFCLNKKVCKGFDVANKNDISSIISFEAFIQDLQKQTNTFNLSFVLPDSLFCLFGLTLYGQHFRLALGVSNVETYRDRDWEFLDCCELLFETVENFSTVETSLLKLSRLRLSIETSSRQIETPRPNFKSKRFDLSRKSFS